MPRDWVTIDLERHEREQEAWLRSRPVCAWCGEPIQEEMCYDIAGELVCENCIDDCRTETPEDWYE